MTRHLLALLTFAALACLGFAVAGQPPLNLPPETKVTVDPEKGTTIQIPKTDDRVTREWIEYDVQQRKKLKREQLVVNGVELAVTVEVAHGKERATEITFAWELAYTGPRSPLHVLEPSLTQPTDGQTYTVFYAVPRKAEQGRVVQFGSPSAWDGRKPGEAGAAWQDIRNRLRFTAVEKGKTATDKTAISVEALKKRLVDAYPKEFNADTPPDLWVEFVHHPTDRAEWEKLDAWTGKITTRLTAVPELKSW